MDLKAELLRDFSKKNTVRIAAMIGPDQGRFDALMILVLKENNLITARAAWVFRHCYEEHPWLVKKHVPNLLEGLFKSSNDPVKRNILAILRDLEIPERLEGRLADYCFNILNSRKEPAAIKVFSMDVLYNLVLKYPDLKSELYDSLQSQLPYGTPGFKNRGQKILKLLASL